MLLHNFNKRIPLNFEKVIAPYWADIRLVERGLVLYAALIEGPKSRLSNSQDIFDIVNDYITDTVLKQCSSDFRAHWILAVRWIDVVRNPHSKVELQLHFMLT